jgi:hypothetical protein
MPGADALANQQATAPARPADGAQAIRRRHFACLACKFCKAFTDR